MKNVTLLKFLLFAVLLFTIDERAMAQDEPLDRSLQESNRLLERGIKESEKGNYSRALVDLTDAELILEKKQFPDELAAVKKNIGIVYRKMSNYGDALGYYKEAIELAKKGKQHKETVPILLNNIAILYLNEKDYKNALDYYNKAYVLAKTNEAHHAMGVIGVNISDIYNRLGNFTESRKILLEVKGKPKSKQFEQFWKINFAESFLVEGKVDIAQKKAEELLNASDDNVCDMCVSYLLSKIYALQNKTDLAIVYAKRALQNSPEMGDRLELYDHISELYYKKQDYELSKYYKNVLIQAKDSMAVLINKGLYESNKVKLKVQDYKNDLEHNNQRHKTERLLFIIGIVFSLTLFFAIYRSMKNRIIKQKQAKIISERQQQIIELELENLKNNVAEKNRKLSAKALYASGRNELVEEIINSMSKIPHIYLNAEVSNYMKSLQNYIKNDSEWDDFILYFEQVNPNFLKTLQEKHSQLLAPDIRFICYVYMNLGIKEISTILNITYEACRKRKQRIATKMGIKADDLQAYLLKIT